MPLATLDGFQLSLQVDDTWTELVDGAASQRHRADRGFGFWRFYVLRA
ncbi:MAG: hypothetical protein WKF73_10775 [Nocardioidaceae bacterium]